MTKIEAQARAAGAGQDSHVPEESPLRPVSLVPSPSREFAGRRVLVADDESVVAGTVERVIRSRLGCRVSQAGSGDAVLSALEAQAYDVLLTDMVMPGLHGLELVSTVRGRWPGTDVIVMSGFPDNFPYVEVVNAGAVDFLSKPHPPAELEAKLLRVFRERSVREARMLAEMKYRSLFELNMNGMVLIDPASLSIIEVNGATCELTGRNGATMPGSSVYDLFEPGERARLEDALDLFAEGGQGTIGDIFLLLPAGRKICLDVSVTFIDTAGQRLVLMAFKDTTEKRELEQKLADMAQTDPLTQLSNQRSFLLRLEWALGRAVTEKMDLTLMALDLDSFKECNDRFGHIVGDEVLAAVGESIRRSIRTCGDEGFRCGGDEFAVILLGAVTENGRRVAERIRMNFANARNFGTSLSIGVAEFREGMRPDDLRRAADNALYQAKAAGKNRIGLA